MNGTLSLKASFRITAAAMVALLFSGGFSALAQSAKNSSVNGKMDFFRIEPVSFSLSARGSKKSCTSLENRLWYAYFQADENYTEKPLFVLLNGGPGCGTSMNLFAMNTAPYTLDRSRVESGTLSALNEFSWTSMGNLLYIDAPNTGFSYMNCKDDQLQEKALRLKEFVSGANYNPFVDAAQVVRALMKFLEENPDIRGNQVILVGESFSGVRISTMLNLILYYKKYADGKKVYLDSDLPGIIESHLKATISHDPPYSPEEIARQFGRQILIQPQIVDKYQQEDKAGAFRAAGSILEQLGKETKADISWKDFYTREKKKVKNMLLGTNMIALQYLIYINRDSYNDKQDSEWTNNNEYSSMLALNDFDELSKITGGTDIMKVKDLLPAERKNALRFAMNNLIPINASNELNLIMSMLDDQKQISLDILPFWHKNLLSMDNPLNSLDVKLGELNDFDGYLVGPTPMSIWHSA